MPYIDRWCYNSNLNCYLDFNLHWLYVLLSHFINHRGALIHISCGIMGMYHRRDTRFYLRVQSALSCRVEVQLQSISTHQANNLCWIIRPRVIIHTIYIRSFFSLISFIFITCVTVVSHNNVTFTRYNLRRAWNGKAAAHQRHYTFMLTIIHDKTYNTSFTTSRLWSSIIQITVIATLTKLSHVR